MRDITSGNELLTTILYIFNQEGLISTLNIDKNTLFNFLKRIQGTYYNVPYHNKTHATDLAQTFFTYVNSCGLRDLC